MRTHDAISMACEKLVVAAVAAGKRGDHYQDELYTMAVIALGWVLERPVASADFENELMTCNPRPGQRFVGIQAGAELPPVEQQPPAHGGLLEDLT